MPTSTFFLTFNPHKILIISLFTKYLEKEFFPENKLLKHGGNEIYLQIYWIVIVIICHYIVPAFFF